MRSVTVHLPNGHELTAEIDTSGTGTARVSLGFPRYFLDGRLITERETEEVLRSVEAGAR